VVIVLDNYDSFTYNLVQYIGHLTPDVKVYRNDALSIEEIRQLAPSHIVISPGPGRPEDAGLSIALVQALGRDTPILGICLGHQAIAAAYGGEVERASEIIHGKTSWITHTGTPLFAGIESPFRATRYHSLIVREEGLPADLEITARSENDLIMGIRHKQHPVAGVQFHPESILTESGMHMIENFIGDPR